MVQVAASGCCNLLQCKAPSSLYLMNFGMIQDIRVSVSWMDSLLEDAQNQMCVGMLSPTSEWL